MGATAGCVTSPTRATICTRRPLDKFAKGLPAKVDLRPQCPPVYDQGQLGSCTANGIAAAIEFDQRKQGNKEFVPSRLFIYYNERVIEGTVSQDSGAQIRDGVKVVAKLGAPPETDWPYNIAKFAQKPPRAGLRRCAAGSRNVLHPSDPKSRPDARAVWRTAIRSSSASQSTRASKARRWPKRASFRCRRRERACSAGIALSPSATTTRHGNSSSAIPGAPAGASRDTA